MEQEIKAGKKISIRSAGKDEYWLQNYICDKPGILGLGDLSVVSRETIQSSGGRLDILMKNPVDNSMYEIEVMLGETDPSHIIRTIEYWDIEKRKYPKRTHYPVLVAENFNKRYFNVLHILSLHVPMIAIQVDMLEVDGQKIINFNKVLNIYEEQIEDEDTNIVNETTWSNDANWTLQTARELLGILKDCEQALKLNFTQSYVALVSSRGNAYMLNKRHEPKSSLYFIEKNEEKVEAIKNLSDTFSIPLTYSKYQEFIINVDKDFIKKNKDFFGKVHNIRFATGRGILEVNE